METKGEWKISFPKISVLLLGVFIFTLFFVMAISTPENLTFEGNTTSNYDKDGNFTLNWSTTGDAAANFSIYIKADGTLFAKVGNDSLLGYSFSNLTNANYSFTVEAENATANLTNSSVDAVWMIVDTIIPSISYSTGTPTNNTAENQDWIFVNVTASDDNNDSLIYSLYNETSLVFQNVTNYSTTTINWTGLPEAKYTFNVTANDSSTNENLTESRIFYLDSTNPTISLSESSSSTSSITVSYSCADATSGVSSCVLSSSSGTPSVTSTNGTATQSTISGLSCSTSYTITVNATDSAENTFSDSESMSTSSCGTSTGSTDPPFYTNTIVEDDVDFTQKLVITKELAEKHRIRIKFDGETHYVGLKSLTGSSAVIEIASDPQEVTLSVAETKKFDLNGDNSYDLEVVLNSISNNKANITLLSIEEPIPEGEITSGETLGETQEEEGEQARTNLIWLWILIGVLVLGGVAWFLINKFSKSKRFFKFGY